VPASPDNLQAVREGMREEINRPLQLELLFRAAGVPADGGGKTGTAQWGGSGLDLPTHAWFVFFAPYMQPDVAMSIFVERGELSEVQAAPIGVDMHEVLPWQSRGHPRDHSAGRRYEARPLGRRARPSASRCWPAMPPGARLDDGVQRARRLAAADRLGDPGRRRICGDDGIRLPPAARAAPVALRRHDDAGSWPCDSSATARSERTRWLSVGGFPLQPSELSKLVLVLVLAAYLSRVERLGWRSFLGALGWWRQSRP